MRSLRFGGAHHRRGELLGMDLRGRIGRAEGLRHCHAPRQPLEVMVAAAATETGNAAIGVEPAITPLPGDPLRQFGVQRKAAPRQRRKRRAAAPVTCQKPARFARSSTGRPGAFDHAGFDAATAEEVGDRGADHATAANRHMHCAPYLVWVVGPAPQSVGRHQLGVPLLVFAIAFVAKHRAFRAQKFPDRMSGAQEPWRSAYAIGIKFYSELAFSASRSTRKWSRRASNSADAAPAASSAMPLASCSRNSGVNVGLPKVSHQLAIGAANWSRK